MQTPLQTSPPPRQRAQTRDSPRSWKPEPRATPPTGWTTQPGTVDAWSRAAFTASTASSISARPAGTRTREGCGTDVRASTARRVGAPRELDGGPLTPPQAVRPQPRSPRLLPRFLVRASLTPFLQQLPSTAQRKCLLLGQRVGMAGAQQTPRLRGSGGVLQGSACGRGRCLRWRAKTRHPSLDMDTPFLGPSA